MTSFPSLLSSSETFLHLFVFITFFIKQVFEGQFIYSDIFLLSVPLVHFVKDGLSFNRHHHQDIEHLHYHKKFPHDHSQSILFSSTLNAWWTLTYFLSAYFCFFRISFKWNHTVCVFWYNAFEIHPYCFMYQ